MAEAAPTRRGNRAPYRALTIPERDLLFALYEKHGSNMLAMTRDGGCQFKSHAQLRYYCHLYNFYPRFIEIRRKQAQEAIAGLQDSKARAIQRAIEMIEPRQVALKDREGNTIVIDGQAAFETVYPDSKTLKIAWEIIKAELGEPTMVSKSDFTSKGERITSVKVTVINGTGPASQGVGPESDAGLSTEPAEHEEDQGQPGGDGQQ